MNLKKRLIKLESAWYTLEAQYYSKSWQELYDQDKDALKKREEFDELIETAVPPFWFWPGRDDWERKYGWAVSNTGEASARFNEMFDRLKRFVDGKQSKQVSNCGPTT